MYVRYVKRILDILISLCGIVVTSPVMAAAAVMIKKKLGSPVLFIQERAGLNGKPFRMYKFRTMRDDRDAEGNLLPDEERLTPFGEKLRSFSIDELPGFCNVLKGDMSVIGPRPLPVAYLDHYDDFQRRRHEVKPGIVGLASVRGRNNQSWDSKFRNDIEYVDTVSFRTDAKIFIKAIAVVLSREGVNAEGYVTSEPISFKDAPEHGHTGS